MDKFIEVTHAYLGEKFLISVDKIVTAEPHKDGTYISTNSDCKGKGAFGYVVSESYDYISAVLLDLKELWDRHQFEEYLGSKGGVQ